MEWMMITLKGIVSGFLASIGFGVLFNIRGKNLVLAGITGMIGTIVYLWALYDGIGEILACFIASICFSLCSEILARIQKTPVTTFLVCALIPLVPGGGMYRMMLAAIQGNVDKAMSIGLQTISIAGILVLGILIVSAATQSYFRLKRVIKKRRLA